MDGWLYRPAAQPGEAGSFALINALMTYLFTGDAPHGLDYIFARVGGNTPEGTPRRITNMSYLREVPMLLKHVQERGGNWLTGMGLRNCRFCMSNTSRRLSPGLAI